MIFQVMMGEKKIYQIIVGEGEGVEMEEKVKRVDDMITKLQRQVQDLQVKINLETPLKEKEIAEKFNKASYTLYQLRNVQLECQTWNNISFIAYQKLLARHEMQEINQEVQQINEKGI